MAWTKERVVTITRDRDPESQRILDLILAGVIGWQWPQYWMNASNLYQRIDEILDATAEEILPWELH
jgi:hypothetical protein